MDKNEILEKSRNENKNADPYEMEINAKAHSYGLWSTLLLCVILAFIKFIKEQRFDFSLVAMMWVLNAVTSTYRAVKLKEQMLVVQAVLSCAAAVIFLAVAFLQIFLGVLG
ncbi:MAG: hypothetical protein K2J72_06340 [Oscillospiraceae bacterium]|nr:hypothetical protein [Oscillospiraceae bacterium]